MAEIHHFAYGWSNPVLAFVLSAIGWTLGLILAARAREARPAIRPRWLLLTAVAFGGGGIWLMRSMAMLGFDVPRAAPVYNLPTMIVSLVLAMVVIGIGLFAVGLPGHNSWRILGAGLFTGAGVAATHYVAVGAIRLPGQIEYNPVPVAISVAGFVVLSCAALWSSGSVRVGSSMIWTALLLAAGSCVTHYVGMAAVRVRLVDIDRPVSGVNPFTMLTPVSVLACVAIGALAYATVGYTMRQERDPDGTAPTVDSTRLTPPGAAAGGGEAAGGAAASW